MIGQGIGVDLHIPKNDAQIEKDGVYISYFDGTEAGTDLMLAKADRTYDSSAPDVSPVALDFNHLLSRVSVCAEAGDDNVTVSSLTFGGMYVYGSYNDAVEDAWQPITKTIEDGVVQEIDQPYGDFDADLSGITFPLPAEEQVVLLPDLLLIPQTPAASGSGLNEMKVTVTYTVGTQPEETKTVFLPQDPAWQPGRHYRYTIKFANIGHSGLSVGSPAHLVSEAGLRSPDRIRKPEHRDSRLSGCRGRPVDQGLCRCFPV